MVSLATKDERLNKEQQKTTKPLTSVQPSKTAWKITLVYSVLGLIWIFFSDWLFDFLIINPEYLVYANIVKGWIYVLATSLLLFVLISLALNEAREHERCRAESYEELKQLHEQLEISEQLLRDQLKDNEEYQERLHYLAYFDVLTNLPNRLSLQRDLQAGLEQEEPVAVLFIDLDNFKDINDFRSHDAGDFLLEAVAKRLNEVTESRGTVYRFGGDQFIVLASSPTRAKAQLLAKSIVQSFQEPFEYHASPIHLTASVGVAHTTDGTLFASDLIKFADLAMHNSKKRGGNCFTAYHHKLTEKTVDRVLLEQQLRTAFEQNQLTLFYQPEIQLETGEITGFEALLRWNPISAINGNPEQVISVAEATGLIIPMGEWILREACTFLKKVHSLGHTNVGISVNISVVQMSRLNFAARVLAILEEVGLTPSYLRLEITESVLMESYDLIKGQIAELRKIGVQMALDDFGKGYSSLSYLKVLPLDTLKIDKSFIDLVPGSQNDVFLTSHIISIGHSLNLQVVAEGVEKQEQLDYLEQHGCDSFQGYLYSPPVAESAAIALLNGKFNPKQKSEKKYENNTQII